MMRSLWTSATGMNAQQMNVDVLANNLANVNTNGFKRERLEFSSLLYDTMRRADLDAANPAGRPVNLQVGSGVRPIATSRVFSPGPINRTENPLDLAIDGSAFFAVRVSPLGADPEIIGYTRDGIMRLSPIGADLALVNNAGLPVLSSDGEPITFPAADGLTSEDVVIQDNGAIFILNDDGEFEDTDILLGLFQFANTQGLEGIGGNLFLATPASGEAVSEDEGPVLRTSTIMQGVLEMSNVSVADEMVTLIVAQRGFELNSRSIQASDQMLQEANNLRR